MVGSCFSSHRIPHTISWVVGATSRPMASSLPAMRRTRGLKWVTLPPLEGLPSARMRDMGVGLTTNVHLHSSFVSPNQFESLANVIPEYRQLRYVDVDVKARESGEWISTRALLDSGGQGSFINDQLSTRYQLPCLGAEENEFH